MRARRSHTRWGSSWVEERNRGAEALCGHCSSASAPRRWQVTTPHTSTAVGGGRKPWGTVHLRREGDGYTACGLPAASWVVFWHYTFQPAQIGSCEECARAFESAQESADAAAGWRRS